MTETALAAAHRREIGPVSRTDFVRYAGAGGDFNPVHHDDTYARKLGFPSVFAMGMWTAGLLGAFVADHLGVELARVFEVRFRSMVFPGDNLTLALGGAQISNGAKSLAASVTAARRITLSGTVCTDIPVAARPAMVDVPASLRLANIASTTFDDVLFPVERGKIIEFARAVRSQSPLHYDIDAARDCGYADLLAPLTFSNCIAHWSGGDATQVPVALGLDVSRVVHGEQRYRFNRPMVAGDVLTARRWVSDVRTKPARSGGDMTLVTVLTEFVDDTDAPVQSEEMVMIEQPAEPQL
jgi:acyl dehydratase